MSRPDLDLSGGFGRHEERRLPAMVPVLWMPLLRGVLANTRDRFSSESVLVVRVR